MLIPALTPSSTRTHPLSEHGVGRFYMMGTKLCKWLKLKVRRVEENGTGKGKSEARRLVESNKGGYFPE